MLYHARRRRGVPYGDASGSGNVPPGEPYNPSSPYPMFPGPSWPEYTGTRFFHEALLRAGEGDFVALRIEAASAAAAAALGACQLDGFATFFVVRTRLVRLEEAARAAAAAAAFGARLDFWYRFLPATICESVMRIIVPFASVAFWAGFRVGMCIMYITLGIFFRRAPRQFHFRFSLLHQA